MTFTSDVGLPSPGKGDDCKYFKELTGTHRERKFEMYRLQNKKKKEEGPKRGRELKSRD